ncbi:HAD family phosphatase [Ostreiculturibacter nitratireducens]|uniref:HAD family hydrolase n=1 Tax=Ostreiculturibacter nitratireducens TaxID=3075226 RepID=UPI0031B5650C
MTPSAVLFDCDGVLVDSEPMTLELLAEDLANHGLTVSLAEMEKLFIGGTMRAVAAKARAMGADLPATWVDDFYERLYALLAEGTPLIPGIEEALDALDAAGIPYAVGSNGTGRKMQITLGQHRDLYARLSGLIFSGQDLGTPKPAPGLWLHAAQALGADPDRAVVVDDSATGCVAARAANMRCLGFAQHNDGASLVAVGAEVFHRMSDLPALVGL